MAVNPQKRIVDLSGFMFSGKSAVSDILREIDGIYVPNYRLEFDLLRMAGGLIDLKNSINNWSPLRTHSALNRFEELVNKCATSPGYPAKLFKTGMGYEKIFPHIMDDLEKFLERITYVEWSTPWPYDDLYDGYIQTFFRKLFFKFEKNKIRRYRLIDKTVFLSAAQEFVKDLLLENSDENADIIVTHNALEPFSPEKNLDLLGNNSRCIVVDRDPCDIYATSITSQFGFNDRLNFYQRIAGAHDINVFIKRHNIYRYNISEYNGENVLRLKFEDVVLKYEETLVAVYDFLEIDEKRHKNKLLYFNPDKSKENIGLWRNKELNSFSDDFIRINNECIRS